MSFRGDESLADELVPGQSLGRAGIGADPVFPGARVRRGDLRDELLLERARMRLPALCIRVARAIRHLAGRVALGENARPDECAEFVVLGDLAVGACTQQIEAL